MLEQFLGEEKLNEHEIAWRSGDWDKVKQLAKQFAEKPDNPLFKLLDEITVNKNRINADENRHYDKYFVNTALSQHADCLYPVYVMNLVGHGLSDQMHFDYLQGSIRKGKRYGKWAKMTEQNDIKLIQTVLSKLYCINVDDAIDYYEIAVEKGYLDKLLKRAKPIATDELIEGVTKNKQERSRLKKLIEDW